MINFEVIHSPDDNVISTYKYFQNQIYLGRKIGNLLINDEEVLESHIIMEVVGGELLIHPQKEVDFYLINGKRASSIRKLKLNDQVTIGKTLIKIIDFTETKFEMKADVLDKKLNQLIEEDSPRLKVIESLTKLMGS